MINMALCPKKRKTKTEKIYYELWEVKWVNGKVVSKYVGYLGKSPKTKQELTPEQLLPYVNKLLDIGLSDVDISQVLAKMNINTDVWPITKIIIEHDRTLKKLFLKFK